MKAEDVAVLIADDVPQMRRLLASYLADLGFREIDMAESGAEVVAAFRQRSYDLAFLDIEMPGLRGLEALPEVLALAPNASVVMISTQGTLDNVKAAVELGAKGFLVKPYAKQKLEDAIRRLQMLDARA
ncbi:MAG: chemotaxis protein CheY [Cyanobacteria bacterium RYN_339]|nr:chemotaxis protein CheY [Cyanobacteria bacterium RYN_339]